MGDSLWISDRNLLSNDIPIAYNALSTTQYRLTEFDRLNPFTVTGSFELVVDLRAMTDLTLLWEVLGFVGGNFGPDHTWRVRGYNQAVFASWWNGLSVTTEAGEADVQPNRIWLTNFTGTIVDEYLPPGYPTDRIDRYRYTGALGTMQMPTVLHPSGAGFAYRTAETEGRFVAHWSDIVDWTYHGLYPGWDTGEMPMTDGGEGTAAFWRRPGWHPDLIRINVTAPANWYHRIDTFWLGPLTRIPLRRELAWSTVDLSDYADSLHGGQRVLPGPAYREIEIPVESMDRATYVDLDWMLRGHGPAAPLMVVYKSDVSPRLVADLSGLFYPLGRRGPTGKISGYDLASGAIKLREWR